MRIELVHPMTGENDGAIVDGVPENDRVAEALEAAGVNPTDTDLVLAQLSGPGLFAVEVADDTDAT